MVIKSISLDFKVSIITTDGIVFAVFFMSLECTFIVINFASFARDHLKFSIVLVVD